MKIFKICFSIGLLILSAFAAAKAQKLVYAGKPKQAAKTASTDSFYAEFPNKIRVYKFQNDADEDRRHYFEIRRGARTLGKIDASVNAFGGRLDSFFAFYGDLDKNKSAELIVVDFDGQGQGLGVNNYTINIFPDFGTRGFSQPLTFNTTEFGRDGTFVYDAKASETLILLTEWGGVQIEDKSKTGADGMYFTGRFFRYQNGKLKPAADKPILARRYLNSFEDERFRTNASPLRPLNWLSSPRAVKLKSDPVFDEKPLTSESGVVEKFERVIKEIPAEAGEGIRRVPYSQIVVRLDSGATRTIVVEKNDYYDELPDTANRIAPEAFGFLPAKQTLPFNLSPLLIFDKLEGKRVQLNSYRIDAETPPIYKLWIVE